MSPHPAAELRDIWTVFVVYTDEEGQMVSNRVTVSGRADRDSMLRTVEEEALRCIRGVRALVKSKEDR